MWAWVLAGVVVVVAGAVCWVPSLRGRLYYLGFLTVLWPWRRSIVTRLSHRHWERFVEAKIARLPDHMDDDLKADAARQLRERGPIRANWDIAYILKEIPDNVEPPGVYFTIRRGGWTVTEGVVSAKEMEMIENEPYPFDDRPTLDPAHLEDFPQPSDCPF